MKKSSITLMLIAAIGFSFNPIIVKILSEEVSYAGILLLRFLLVVFLFPFIAIVISHHDFRSFFSIEPRQLLKFFLLSFLLIGNMLLFFYSFNYITVNRAIFIFFMYPIIAIIMARIFIKELITKQDTVATLLSFIGIIIIFLNTNLEKGKFIGDIMVIASVLMWSGYVVLNRYTSLRELHYRQTFWLFFFSALLLLPSYFFLDTENSITNLSLTGLYLILVIGIFSTLIPYSILNYVSREIKTSVIGMLVLLSQVFSIFLAFAILGEKATPNVVIGGLLIVFSAIIATYNFDKLFSFKRYLMIRIKNEGLLAVLKIIKSKL